MIRIVCAVMFVCGLATAEEKPYVSIGLYDSKVIKGIWLNDRAGPRCEFSLGSLEVTPHVSHRTLEKEYEVPAIEEVFSFLSKHTGCFRFTNVQNWKSEYEKPMNERSARPLFGKFPTLHVAKIKVQVRPKKVENDLFDGVGSLIAKAAGKKEMGEIMASDDMYVLCDQFSSRLQEFYISREMYVYKGDNDFEKINGRETLDYAEWFKSVAPKKLSDPFMKNAYTKMLLQAYVEAFEFQVGSAANDKAQR